MAKQGFISWSGEESRGIAEQLKDLFGLVLPAPQLFVASRDIKAGEVWFTEIAQRLEACDVGVIVVTPQNLNKPWLYFEAGALAKKVGRSATIPLLCGVSVGDLANTPLASLQSLTTSEADIMELCGRLNEVLDLGLAASHIDRAFPKWWADFADKIDNPEIWKGSKKEGRQPTTADLSVQITQVASALADLSDRLGRPSYAEQLADIAWANSPDGLPEARPVKYGNYEEYRSESLRRALSNYNAVRSKRFKTDGTEDP